jgi:hypothetical protein
MTTPHKQRWLVRSDQVRMVSQVHNTADFVVADFHGHDHEVNARLFAAAPALHELARDLAAAYPDCRCNACLPCAARKVIGGVT